MVIRDAPRLGALQKNYPSDFSTEAIEVQSKLTDTLLDLSVGLGDIDECGDIFDGL